MSNWSAEVRNEHDGFGVDLEADSEGSEEVLRIELVNDKGRSMYEYGSEIWLTRAAVTSLRDRLNEYLEQNGNPK